MSTLENVLYFYTFIIFGVLSLFDVRTRMVPNYLTIGSYPIFALLLIANSIGGEQPKYDQLNRAAIGAILISLFFFLSLITAPNSVGVGDLKIAPLFGAILAWGSWQDFGVGIAICFLSNGLAALILLAAKKVNRKTHLPLIPFMLLGLTFVTAPIFI